jgi:DnaD/phage-associated family protein
MTAEFRSVQTRMWREDDWFQGLETDARLLFIYLFTNPSASISGIYRLPLRTMAFESGLPVERVQQLLNQFSEQDKAHYADGVIWVVKMRENQLPGKISENVGKRLTKDIASIPYCDIKRRYLIAYGYPVDTVSIPRATDTETETETDTETKQNAPGGGSDSGSAELELSAVYSCWEDNMPGTLSPILSDELFDLVKTYTASEVIRAINIAVTANKRNMKYVAGILRNRAAGDEPRRNVNGTPPKAKQVGYIRDPRTGEQIEVQL